ncbi:MAG: hypothetical protein KDB88_10115 [Flavobacteriales bacterium]|nr:hypothetical protein [Flavobacteriales bacterium]
MERITKERDLAITRSRMTSDDTIGIGQVGMALDHGTSRGGNTMFSSTASNLGHHELSQLHAPAGANEQLDPETLFSDRCLEGIEPSHAKLNPVA